MKDIEKLKLRVGIFIVIGLAALLAVVFMVGGKGSVFSRKFSVYADFTNISGLRIGAPVYLAGINVGEVSGISFPTTLESPKVRIKMKIQEEFHDRVRKDSTAAIQSQGLLGDKLVFINVGSPAIERIPDGGFLSVESQSDFGSLVEKGNTLLDNLNEVMDKINRTLGDDKHPGSLKDISALLKSLRGILAEVEKGEGLAHAIIYDDRGEKTVGDIQEMTADLKEMAENFRNISDRIEAGEGSVGGLITDPTVYYDLKTLLGKANRNKLLKAIIRSTLKKKDETLIGGEKE